MLSIVDGPHSRRSFLRIGTLGLGGLSLSSLLAARARAATLGEAMKDTSVVFLFLHGGPPQAETFDPKMTAPAGIRSVTGERATTIPGITFGATLERLAKLAHKITIVRSFTTGDGNHDIKPIVCRDTLGANLGSLCAGVVGTSDAVSGMPTNVALFPRAVDPSTQPARTQFGRFDATGALGRAYAPFIPGSGSTLQEDMTLQIERRRLAHRRSLLDGIDRLRRTVDASGALEGMDRLRSQAFDTILGAVANAFDLSKEDPRVVARYDTAALVRPHQISKKWNNYNNYLDNAKTLGKLLLLSRRLCEAGVKFVTVTTNFVWDMHADQNNATIEEGMMYNGVPFDHAVSAFLEDVAARGLSEKILLVACGEMGRTPKVNKRGGRDHWGRLAPLLLAGGGLPMGQVIGSSTADVGEPNSEPVTNKNLIATVLGSLFDVGQLRLLRGVPEDILRVADAEPIRGLI